jgi:hypothetical protein
MTFKQTDREKGAAWFGSLSEAERWAQGVSVSFKMGED